MATAIGGQLARAYRGDLASADWRHLGRLAGVTNQKPLRRQPNGYAPWVRVLHTRVGLATHGASLVEAAHRQVTCTPGAVPATGSLPGPLAVGVLAASCTPSAASGRLPPPHRHPGFRGRFLLPAVLHPFQRTLPESR